MKAIFDPNKRIIILVATKPKLDQMTATSEIGAIINSVVDSQWSPTGLLGRLGRDLYRRSAVKLLSKMPEEEVLSRFNTSMDLGVPAVCFEPSRAIGDFDFGVGHIPKDGDIYIQHPINKSFYISPSEFSRTICSEKEAAFLRLAATLGAKSIRLNSIQTNDTKGFFNSKFSAPEIAADLGFNATFDKNGSVMKEVVKEFNRPKFKDPFVPEDLKRWVEFDTDLRTMSSDRIEANASRCTVKLEYSQNLGLGGELSAKIADRGFNAGGNFKSMSKSIWSFDVEYYDLSAS